MFYTFRTVLFVLNLSSWREAGLGWDSLDSRKAEQTGLHLERLGCWDGTLYWNSTFFCLSALYNLGYLTLFIDFIWETVNQNKMLSTNAWYVCSWWMVIVFVSTESTSSTRLQWYRVKSLGRLDYVEIGLCCEEYNCYAETDWYDTLGCVITLIIDGIELTYIQGPRIILG